MNRFTSSERTISYAHAARESLRHLAVFALAALIAFLAPTMPASAQNVAGEPGGIPESGSLSLSNALASAALDPSTGVLTASLPFDLPAARGGAQPGLALTYNSAAGIREAGVGWGLDLPSIERSNHDGAPRYGETQRLSADVSFELSGLDRFLFNGAPLVPVCRVVGRNCMSGADRLGYSGYIDEANPIPEWATNDWIYFRLETDTSRARFYLSPDFRTWRVQFVGGEILELGEPLVQRFAFADPLDAGIDYDSVRLNDAPVQRYPFRWNPVRRYDAHTQRVAANLIIYRWARLGERGLGFLTDIYDTPSALPQGAKVLQAADFAHHAKLLWRWPPYMLIGPQIRTFRTTPDKILDGVNVTSSAMDGGPKQLVRRYHLSYVSDGNRYYLTAYELEGRCAFVEELPDGTLPVTTCPRLPPTRLRYSQRVQNTTAGYYGIPLIHEPGKPADIAVVDVNRDGLPDMIEMTDEPSARLYLNGLMWNTTVIEKSVRSSPFSHVGRTVMGAGSNAIPQFPHGSADSVFWEGAGMSVFWEGLNGGGYTVSAYPRDGGEWKWRETSFIDTELGLGTPHWSWTRATVLPGSRVGDVDGDGRPDAVYQWSASDDVPGDWPATWKQDGNTVTRSLGAIDRYQAFPATRWSCFGPSPETVEDFKPSNDEAPPAVVDMNGDGLGDLVYTKIAQAPGGEPSLAVTYWPGDGRGNFNACTRDVCPCTAGRMEASSIKFEPIALDALAGGQGRQIGFGDLNGDGFADLVVASQANVKVFWNTDGRRWHHLLFPNLTIPGTSIAPNWNDSSPIRLSFADANGNGLTDAVFVVGDRVAFFDSQSDSVSGLGPTRSGLLIGIDNGLGASTDITYQSTAALAKSKPDHRWVLPQVLHVVTKISVTSGLAADEPQVVSYDYDNPVFDDLHERRFRGFRNVTAWNNHVRTDNTYVIGDGGLPYRGTLLAATEISDIDGRYYSTTVRSYRVQEVVPDASTDANFARSAYPEQVDTILYDTTDPAPSDGSTTPVTVTWGHDKDRVVWTVPISVRSRTNARTRITQRLDDRGNVVEHVDMGRIRDNGKPWDDPIVRTVVMSPPRADWKFLPESVTVSPFPDRSALGVPLDQPRTRTFKYDDLGRVVGVFATLSGTVPLERGHEDPSKRLAPAPPSASKDDSILLVHNKEYDAFGNVTLALGPNEQCVSILFDKEYAHLPIKETLHTQGCGSGMRSSSSKWDRGFAIATEKVAHDRATSRIELDEFGRTVATYDPDPVSGAVSELPSTSIAYYVKEAGPVQRVKVVSAAGAGRRHTTWTYTDSLGRHLLTLDQADPGAGDLGAWVASGLPERWRGIVKRVYEPWFYSGDPANHPLTPPPSASTSFDFDRFGRVTEVTGLDGTTTHRRVYRALGTEDVDAAGRVSITRLNGHGQVFESTVRAAGHEQTSRFQYQVGGELAYVARVHDGDEAADSIRWLQYDSFGRLVINAEPNTSKNFDGPANAGAMRAWRYAYDDSGHLVGTSDARGCGKNIFYDIVGRAVAEDFSPCLSSHEEYSELDPATGDGAEVLRTYDAPEAGQTTDLGLRPKSLLGRLSATRDRAAHTRFGYDGRGRLVSVARQIARPGGIAPPAAPAAGGTLGAAVTASGRAAIARANARGWLVLCASLAALLLFMLRARRAAPTKSQRLRHGISALATVASLALLTTACSGHGAAAGELVRLSSSALSDSGYEATWARTEAAYDDANRVVRQTTGADVPELLGAGGQSVVTVDYSLRGAVQSMGGSYGPLLAGEVHEPDGLPNRRRYADAAQTSARYEYDARRRVENYELSRALPGPWTTGPSYTPPAGPGPSTLQRVLLDNGFAYDAVGNPTSVDDKRNPGEWPQGFAPVNRTMRYDAFDRISRIDYAYHGLPEWSDPLAFERGNGRSPVPSIVTPKRVGWQTFDYDPLGNLRETKDDANLFYDRSLGPIAHGTRFNAPNQIRSAGSDLSAIHDDAGNLVDLVVRRAGPCTDATGCVQRFHYDWDEIGQLARARRWDFTSIDDVPGPPGLPASPATADLSYLYDGSGVRVLKKSVATGGEIHYTAEIFGSLRLELATWDDVAERYTRTPTTEAVYLGGIARVVHDPTLPSATANPQHVFLMLPDHLGSTAVVIDRDTSEVVERTTQQAYGAPDSDYRPDRWAGFREPYQFTGKEDDYEVGLTYFGARYYHAALGRFASADPLTIHGLGGDSNPYAYVRGAVLSATDPFGLSCAGSIGMEMCPGDTGFSLPIDLGGIFGGGNSNGGGGGSGGSRSSTPSPTYMPPLPAATANVMLAGLNPAIPSTIRPASLPTVPDQFADQDVPIGSAGQFLASTWNAAVRAFPYSPLDPLSKYLAHRYLIVAEKDDGSLAEAAGSAMPFVAMAFGGGELSAGAEAIESRLVGAAEGAAAEAGGGQMTTVIGRMKDLGKFAGDPAVDTWAKSGRIPGVGGPPVTWAENAKWLTERVVRGDKFGIATNPATLPPVRGGYIPGTPNGYFTARELDFLRRLGIDPIRMH